MGDLTQNISRHELACECGCGFDTMDWETIQVVQEAVDYFEVIKRLPRAQVTITSAARCLEHNRKIGSTDASQHTKGRAIDFVIKGVEPSEVYAYLHSSYRNKYGIGSYNSFTHIDTRSGPKARW